MIDQNENNNLDDVFLHQFGDIAKNSLCHLLDVQDETADDLAFDHIKHSAYFDQNLFPLLEKNREKFSVLSSNIECINSKYDELATFIDGLKHNYNFEFSAIVLQETWLTDNCETSIYKSNYLLLCPKGIIAI